VEEEEGAEGSIPPLVAAALVIGVGRSSQAAAAAMQIARGMTGDGGSE
jgi:hypothetical protein